MPRIGGTRASVSETTEESSQMRAIHVCAGIGGGLLAGLVLGHEAVAAVEIDPFCCAILRERAAEGWFPGLAVHECDMREWDPTPYAGRVDLLCAGWPCQGISRIGSRLGLADERSGLWSEVVRIARILRPKHLFLENGPDVVSLCLDRVLADIASMGMDARWGIVAAANAGASHGRDRWWCVANAVCDGLEGIHGGGAASWTTQ